MILALGDFWRIVQKRMYQPDSELNLSTRSQIFDDAQRRAIDRINDFWPVRDAPPPIQYNLSQVLPPERNCI